MTGETGRLVQVVIEGQISTAEEDDARPAWNVPDEMRELVAAAIVRSPGLRSPGGRHGDFEQCVGVQRCRAGGASLWPAADRGRADCPRGRPSARAPAVWPPGSTPGGGPSPLGRPRSRTHTLMAVQDTLRVFCGASTRRPERESRGAGLVHGDATRLNIAATATPNFVVASTRWSTRIAEHEGDRDNIPASAAVSNACCVLPGECRTPGRSRAPCAKATEAR